ncbi:MAG TPA: DUF1080 domain-containing protein [Prolixibacteraceae bacterium]|nr:DUF1080 domain-containing protein [Prolixibacteraceae bacterium]
MRKLFVLVILIVISFGTYAAKGNWEKIFNGKDLTGWERLNGTAEYTVVNGEIVGTSKTNSPNTFLATTRTFGDFILEYEMKMDTGLNSGVQIRSLSRPDYNNGRVHGYQVECDDAPRGWSAGIYDEARRGWLYPMEYNQAAKKSYKRAQWNKYRVEAIGNSIRTWLNGVPCANLVDDMTPAGFIALQVHAIGKEEANAGKTILWRDIRIMTKDLEANRKKMDKSVVEVSYLNNTLTDNEKTNDWKLLWDGKTTNGWRGAGLSTFPDKGWTIEDGMLIPNKGENKGGGDIVTVKKYKKFVLEADFKITEGANSGIKYFIQSEPGKPNTVGFEFQVLDDVRHPDAKLGIDGNRTLASLYDLVKADSRVFDPAQPVKRVNGVGQWNRARIEVDGKKVTHYLNGVKVLEIVRGSDSFKKHIAQSKFKKEPGFGDFDNGYILLQDHGNEVAFRNIKIKEL